MRPFLLSLAIWVFCPLLAMAQIPIFEQVEGQWALDPEAIGAQEFTCADSPLTISIDSQSLRYTGTHKGEAPRHAQILDYGDDWLSIKYEGETRTMGDGAPQIWILFLSEPDIFYWVREDWIDDAGNIDGATAARHRCAPKVG